MTTKSEGMMISGKLKWYIILALTMWLAFSGVAAAEQLYVNEGGWWRDSGAFNASGAPISAAVGAAAAGDSIYVEGGNYCENVDLDKPLLTLEGAGADVVTVTAAVSGDHVFEVTKDYINISGFAARGTTDSDVAGIYLDNADYCNSSENNVYGNYRGIFLSDSNSNTLSNNTANSNSHGIYMESSSNNTLENNTANSNNLGGIYLLRSSNNTLKSNTANSNSDDGIYIESSSNNTLENNAANSNTQGCICLSHSSNNTLKSNTANSNSHGIRLYNADNNDITCNWVQNNTQNGFHLCDADNNNIACNLVQNNTEQGFYIHSGSTGNNVNYNNILENGNYNAATGGWKWQFYMGQYQPVEAKHNYWGAGMNNSTIDASIYDDEEGGWGEVEFYPFETEPVTPVNMPPIASFTHYPLNPIVNQMVTFNASNSADSDGTITNYEWDFGDGNTTNTTEETITHFYTSAEDYTVNLTVADDEGATNSTSKAITVYPPTIIYVPDDYAKIQWAVDNASAGDTIFVWNGSYNENVNVYKQLTLDGEGADVVTVTAASPDDHVFEVTKDYTSISGFAVRGATDYNMAGVYLDNVDHCNISRNSVYGNYRGIYLRYSSNNTLTNNNANSNSNGICLFSSSYNTLTNNNANSNSDGIYLLYSSNYNALTSNNASNNDYGILLVDSSNNTLTDNTANSNNWGDGIYLRSSSNNELTGNTANSNNNYGIYLDYSSNYNTLTNNTANSNSDGIYLYDSSNNTLTNNTANSNNYDGIYLYSSSNNTLTGNTANLNNWGDGIYLRYSSNNELTGNTANSNNDYGIYLYNADDNNIACNLVQNNTERGFYLTGGSTGNNISYNNIIENGNYNAASGGWEWQFYIAQYQTVEAKHNYWGAGMNNSTIDASIYDDEEGWGEVEFYPFETEPVQCPLTPEPPALLEADAGDDQHTSQGTLVMLDGSGSTGALTYNWTEDGIVLSDQISFSHEFSVGIHTITLTVSDGANTDNDAIIVRVNCPPVADAGEDRVISPDTYVKLDASGSKDLDGSIVSYEWTEDGVPLSTRKSFNKIFGYGVHKVTLTVTDDFGDQDTDCMIVMILLRGDLNHDGIITPADAAIALQLAARGECAAGASADPRTTSLVSAAGATSVPVAETTQTSALGMIVTDATCNVTLDARYGGAEAQEVVVTFTLTNTGDQPITVYQPALPSPREGITLTALDNYPITIPSNAPKTVQINVRVAGDVAEGTYNATAYFGDSTATITIDVRRLTRYNLDCEIADVSGDGPVTSLDALMIMQAAAGA